MGIIRDILTKIKAIFSGLWRRFGLLLIITFIWFILLVGFVFLAVYIGIYFVPHPNFVTFMTSIGFSLKFVSYLTSAIQVAIGAGYILIWLYLWHRLMRMYFWRTVKKYITPSEEPTE